MSSGDDELTACTILPAALLILSNDAERLICGISSFSILVTGFGFLGFYSIVKCSDIDIVQTEYIVWCKDLNGFILPTCTGGSYRENYNREVMLSLNAIVMGKDCKASYQAMSIDYYLYKLK